MLRRRRHAYPYLRLKDWADSGESMALRCGACAAEARLRPAALIARHGWHGAFAKAVNGLTCVECGGPTEVVLDNSAQSPERGHDAARHHRMGAENLRSGIT